MYDVYLKKIYIDKVRHLKDVSIPVSDEKKKNLIITGKNGSGKTSFLNALAKQLNFLTTQGDFSDFDRNIKILENQLKCLKNQNGSENQRAEYEKYLEDERKRESDAKAGLSIDFNVPISGIYTHFAEGGFILAYYEANRKFNAVIPKHVEKVNLKDSYGINEQPRAEFIKYILDLKMTEALAQTSGKEDRASAIKSWFDNFEKLLKNIFDDNSVKLVFDEETFEFSIHQDGREDFGFQGLSDGYAAVLDIVVDIMVRMQKHLNGRLNFDMPGIVLIDEIETHLHLELQRTVLKFLTGLFPNVQFVVTTHSPFILSSAENATIFDLENRTCVTEGLTNLPYDGIVKGYFEVDSLSGTLRGKFERYKELVKKDELNDDEIEELTSLEMYLDEIPDYLALEISTEYHRLKADFEKREDL